MVLVPGEVEELSVGVVQPARGIRGARRTRLADDRSTSRTPSHTRSPVSPAERRAPSAERRSTPCCRLARRRATREGSPEGPRRDEHDADLAPHPAGSPARGARTRRRPVHLRGGTRQTQQQAGRSRISPPRALWPWRGPQSAKPGSHVPGPQWVAGGAGLRERCDGPIPGRGGSRVGAAGRLRGRLRGQDHSPLCSPGFRRERRGSECPSLRRRRLLSEATARDHLELGQQRAEAFDRGGGRVRLPEVEPAEPGERPQVLEARVTDRGFRTG